LPWAGTGLAFLAIGAMCTSLLIQGTFVELSQARASRWQDACSGFTGNTLRLFATYLVAIGIPVLILVLLSLLPEWLEAEEWSETARDAVSAGVIVLSFLIWVFLGPLLSFTLLLGPILIVEECSAGQALRFWQQFLRQHFTKAFLYETLAGALAALTTLPLLVPVFLAPRLLAPVTQVSGGLAADVFQASLNVLTGLALTPFIAYLTVANLFIYLNLRYELGPRR
jgi:hypothetical protein